MKGKHIERKYHLIREIVQRGDIIVEKIASEDNLAYPFTKALKTKVFGSHVYNIGLKCTLWFFSFMVYNVISLH